MTTALTWATANFFAALAEPHAALAQHQRTAVLA